MSVPQGQSVLLLLVSGEPNIHTCLDAVNVPLMEEATKIFLSSKSVDASAASEYHQNR